MQIASAPAFAQYLQDYRNMLQYRSLKQEDLHQCYKKASQAAVLLTVMTLLQGPQHRLEQLVDWVVSLRPTSCSSKLALVCRCAGCRLSLAKCSTDKPLCAFLFAAVLSCNQHTCPKCRTLQEKSGAPSQRVPSQQLERRLSFMQATDDGAGVPPGWCQVHSCRVVVLSWLLCLAGCMR